MKRNLAKLIILVTLISGNAYASFKEHYDLGQQYLSSYQYSGAITEFKNALRINYLDNSARIGLINSYISRATYYANTEHNYQKAADDYRSALFYILYYPQKNNTSSQSTEQIKSYLNICQSRTGFKNTSQNHYDTAKQLRAEGNFAAAAYEFNQALGDRSLQKNSFEQVGDIMKLLGNKEKSAEYYRKAIAVSPSDINLRMSYAKILDSLGKENDAVNEYNYVLSKINDDKDILYSLERIYKKKLENTPENADITANLGAIMQKQGKYDDALMYYQKSEYLNPSNINTRLNVGTLYQQKGDYKTAIKAYDSILIVEPNNVNANLYKAQANESLGLTKEALEGYKKVLSLDPANNEAQIQMLNLVKGNMTIAQFIDYAKKNMATSNISELFYNYALDLHKQNKLSDAITMYKESLKQNSENYEAYINLAIAQNQQNETELALQTLNNALTKFPSNQQIKTAISEITLESINGKLANAAKYYEAKDYKNAIVEYKKIEPATVDSLIGIASSYQALNDINSAIEYYKQALKLKPTDSDIAYYIAVLYSENSDWDSAKAYLVNSLNINKNNTKAKDFLTNINEQITLNKLNKAIEAYDNEKYDEALPILNEILLTDSNNSYAYYYRGMINDSKENRADAINDFKKAYTLNKDFEIANYLIAVDYDSLGKYKEAYNYYSLYSNSTAQDDEYKQYAKTRAEELKEYAK